MKLYVKLLILFSIFAACHDIDKQSPQTQLSSQTDIEKIKLTNLSGASIKMKQYKGKAVFINFWAGWCKPCTEEMPTIKNVIDSLSKEKIEFLFASIADKKEVEDFESEHKYGFNYVTAENMEELNIVGLPTTFIFDKDGKKIFSDMGYRKWDDKTNLNLLLKIAQAK